MTPLTHPSVPQRVCTYLHCPGGRCSVARKCPCLMSVAHEMPGATSNEVVHFPEGMEEKERHGEELSVWFNFVLLFCPGTKWLSVLVCLKKG